MNKLIFPGSELRDLSERFKKTDLESFALILAQPVRVKHGVWRLLVQSINEPNDSDYDVRTRVNVTPSAEFRIVHEKRAHRKGLSVIYCHSHPAQDGLPEFSRSNDDPCDRSLLRYMRQRVPKVPHGSLLIGKDQLCARELGTKRPMEVWQVGADIRRLFPSPMATLSPVHDRQVRAFGEDGQRALQSLHVGIVGCGGTGSIVAQELAYLGVQRFVLFDPDTVEKTNLNRVVGAAHADIGRSKVQTIKRLIKRINPRARVDINRASILSGNIGRRLLAVDAVLCCTDSEGSRFLINQMAYQYFIPVIDMGVSITSSNGSVVDISGRVQMLAPGLGCLVCVDGTLDGRKVMWDLQNDEQQRADPYFREFAGIKQPAVISLNGTVASQAVSLLLAAVAGIPIRARSIRFRGLRGDARDLDYTPRIKCANCSEEAYFGKGDLFRLPQRIVVK